MWYKRFCSATFENELKQIYKYVTIDLKSSVGWQAIKRNIWAAVSDEGGPLKYQSSRNITMKNNVKRMTIDKYTVFYQVDYDKKEIYLLHLLYRKN